MATVILSNHPVSLPSSSLDEMADGDAIDEAPISNPVAPESIRDVPSPNHHAFFHESKSPKAPMKASIPDMPELHDGAEDTAASGIIKSQFKSPIYNEPLISGPLSAPETVSASESETSSEYDFPRPRPFSRFKLSTPLSFAGRSHMPPGQLTASKSVEHLFRPTEHYPTEHYPTSPSQSDTASNVSENRSSRGKSDEIQTLWTKLEAQRQAIRDRRADMTEKRREMRRIQRKKDDADNAFMQFLRPLLLNPRLPSRPYDAIERRLTELHRFRDDYNAATSIYETLEEDLDRDEELLESLESRFFDAYYGVATGNDRTNSSKHSSVDEEELPSRPPSRTSLLGISGELSEDIHPLYNALLDAAGERDLAYEHYTELVSQRDTILYGLEMTLKRERFREIQGQPDQGVTVFSEDDAEGLRDLAHSPNNMSSPQLEKIFGDNIRDGDLKFLMEFNTQEDNAREALEDAAVEVRRLRDLCKQKGVMRKNPPYHEEYTIHVASGRSSPPPSNMPIQHLTETDAEDLAHPEFPILLSNPSHVLQEQTAKGAMRSAVRLPKEDPTRKHKLEATMKEFDIVNLLSGSREEDKADYINRWLLQKLRISPLEVRIFLSIWPARLRIRNMHRWQEDVLYHWSRDEAAKKPASVFDSSRTLDDHAITEGVDAFVNSEIGLGSQYGSGEGNYVRRESQDPMEDFP